MKKNERLKIKMNPEFCPIVVSMKLIHNILSTSGRPRAVKAAGQPFVYFEYNHVGDNTKVYIGFQNLNTSWKYETK